MRVSLLAMVLLLPACAMPAKTWRSVYVTGSAASDFIEATHKLAWDDPLNRRAEECAETLPEEPSDAEVDECLGRYVNNPKVIEALERYDAAADILAATLLATDPNGDQADVIAAWTDVIAAGRDLLRLFPEAEKYLRQLDVLTRRVK